MNRVKVERDAVFSAEIEGDFNCHDSQFTDVLDFKNFKVVGKIVLSNSLIKGEVKLHNLKNSFRLRGTNFVNRPPELFGSDLKPDSDLALTLPAKRNPDHINIYEDLRQHAERLGKLEEKKHFVHAELSCRAIDPQKPPAERFVW